MMSIPMSAKSRTLRVATAIPRERAIAAIWTSACETATHIHARMEHRAMTRSLIERSLIQELRPQMNAQLKPIFSSPYARILQNQK